MSICWRSRITSTRSRRQTAPTISLEESSEASSDDGEENAPLSHRTSRWTAVFKRREEEKKRRQAEELRYAEQAEQTRSYRIKKKEEAAAQASAGGEAGGDAGTQFNEFLEEAAVGNHERYCAKCASGGTLIMCEGGCLRVFHFG